MIHYVLTVVWSWHVALEKHAVGSCEVSLVLQLVLVFWVQGCFCYSFLPAARRIEFVASIGSNSFMDSQN